MKLYRHLAWDGIRKNSRLYVPYLLTGVGAVSFFYILVALSRLPEGTLPGSGSVQVILNLGSFVLWVFSLLLLFYTHSFLIRRRNREFALYNVLGMGKRDIARILCWETLLSGGISLAGGLALGILLGKLAELGLLRMVGAATDMVYRVSAGGLLLTLGLYGAIYLLILISSLVRVGRSTAVQLMRSQAEGEKPPRANWALAVLGILLLAGAYYLAVTIREPLMALSLFFVAVILVILATYLIMISGSVLLCRQLQKNTAYYYNPRHFVSVSSMAYRMKRNGAGLASVCILATMVLVMISSTTSLYFGTEGSLMARYPWELMVEYRFESVEDLAPQNVSELRGEIDTILAEQSCTPQNVSEWRALAISGYLKGSRGDFARADESGGFYTPKGEICNFYFIPQEDYNARTGETVALQPGEALVYDSRGTGYSHSELDLGYGLHYDIVGQALPWKCGSIAMDIAPTLVLVVPDLTEAEHGLAALGQYPACRWNYGFDTGLPAEKQAEISNSLYDANIGMHDDYTEAHGIRTRTIECRTMNEADFFGTYGGLFCLGIILSVEFLFAAVLIIYYKQISEGYEDQSRFGIMQKVGMTKTEIRRSINSQLLTVFYLPLVMAGLHLAFAFPMIRRLLLLFNLNNVGLFALTTVISFVMFGVLYALIYRITGNVYYRIVSDIHDRE